MLGWKAAGVPCSPFRSATPHSTASRARRFPLQMIFNCSIFDGNHCSNLDGSGQSLCVNQHLYQDNINSIKRETSRSKEDFVKEHFVKYPQSNLPSWKALEIVSFGTLSKVFSNLSDNSLKKSIARKLGLPQHKILENWLQSLSSLRNCIAHHARVWNRVFPSTPTLPTNVTGLWIENSSVDQSRLYAHLCCLEFLHNQIHPDNDFSEQLKELIYQHKNIDIHAMGFPSGWENEPLWK